MESKKQLLINKLEMLNDLFEDEIISFKKTIDSIYEIDLIFAKKWVSHINKLKNNIIKQDKILNLFMNVEKNLDANIDEIQDIVLDMTDKEL